MSWSNATTTPAGGAIARAVLVGCRVAAALAVPGSAVAVTCPSLDQFGIPTPSAMAGVDWSGCDLISARLIDADLSNANLTGAYLTDANMTGANLSHTNLTNA